MDSSRTQIENAVIHGHCHKAPDHQFTQECYFLIVCDKKQTAKKTVQNYPLCLPAFDISLHLLKSGKAHLQYFYFSLRFFLSLLFSLPPLLSFQWNYISVPVFLLHPPIENFYLSSHKIIQLFLTCMFDALSMISVYSVYMYIFI